MLAFFAASIVRPRCAFFGYFIVMTFRPGELYPALGAMRFELVVVIFLLVLMLIHGRGQRLALSFDPLSKSVLIFFGLCIVSIVQAYDISYSYDYAYRVLFPTIIFYVSIVCFADDISDFKMFLYLYIFIVAYLGWLPIFNHFHGIGHERIGAGIIHAKGTTGGVAGHVALANLMVQSMPFAYFMMIQEKGYLKKILLVGALAVYTIAIISSGSRGGFLGMLICGALFVAKSRNKVVSLALIVGGFFAASSLMSDNYLHWMTSILDLGSSDVSASSRWTGLRHGIELAFKRPLLGVASDAMPRLVELGLAGASGRTTTTASLSVNLASPASCPGVHLYTSVSKNCGNCKPVWNRANMPTLFPMRSSTPALRP